MEIANKSQAENGIDNTTIMTPLRVKQSIAANGGGGSGGTTDYTDLSNKPKINNVELNGNKTAQELGISGNIQADWNVSDPTNGAYINNKPTIPNKTSDLTNDSGFITKSVNNLDNYTKTSSLATVATSGSYADLSNKPTIPTVNNATLTIQKNGTTVETFTANSSTNKTANITVPTKTSDLTNDSGYITSSYHDSTKQDTLISGSNIKTLNNLSLLGSGDLVINDIKEITSSYIEINSLNTGYYHLPANCLIYNKRKEDYFYIVNNSALLYVNAENASNLEWSFWLIDDYADYSNISGNATIVYGIASTEFEWGNWHKVISLNDLVSDASYVHTDNNYTSSEKTKLSGIAAGAEVNVQSDWNETNSSSDAYIKNKPDFTYIDSEISNLWDGENYLAESTIRKLIGTSETPINLNEFTYEDEDFGVLETRGIYAIKGRIVIGDETFDLPNYGIFVVNSWESNEKVVQYFGGELSGVYNVQRTQSGGTYTYTYTFDPYHTWEQFESDLDVYLLNELSYYLEDDLKTINNTSIVGSGNISVQPTLVSGTNIKTINNETLLGSGNINISGGEKGLEELTSPVYIEDTADGAYRVPTGCVIGTYTADKGGILLVTSKTIDSHLVKFWYLIDSVGDVAFDGDNSELLDYDINFKYGVACEDTGDEWEHDLISISDLVNVQANWNETNSSSAAYIQNKPTLSTVATSGNYNDLSNKPTIPTVNNATLTIQKNGSTIDTFTANSSTNKTVNITVDTFTHETVYLDEWD